MSIYTRRLHKEIKDFQTNPPHGVILGDTSNISCWEVTLHGAEGTLYEGEVFKLQFTFPPNYPIESPEVVFKPPAPIHPHIYSNGHICLSILYDQWSPAMTCQSVCLSIQSMLSSSSEKVPPANNLAYVATAAKNPKKTNWVFHDDKC
jgi:ubiquitin-conjugating enzyme E2 W